MEWSPFIYKPASYVDKGHFAHNLSYLDFYSNKKIMFVCLLCKFYRHNDIEYLKSSHLYQRGWTFCLKALDFSHSLDMYLYEGYKLSKWGL